MRSLITTLFTFAFAFSVLAAEVADSAQVAAIRSINKLLEAKNFEEVYREWCHPHLQEHLTKQRFVKLMNEDFGKGEIKLFADVIKGIDEKAGPDVIVAQPQVDKDEYEFVLTKVKQNNPIGRDGIPWHIELKLHDGKWKLKDTD